MDAVSLFVLVEMVFVKLLQLYVLIYLNIYVPSNCGRMLLSLYGFMDTYTICGGIPGGCISSNRAQVACVLCVPAWWAEIACPSCVDLRQWTGIRWILSCSLTY